MVELVLIIASSVGLNDILGTAFGWEAAASPLMLCMAIALLIKTRPAQCGPAYYMYGLVLISYLVIGALAYGNAPTMGSAARYIVSYAGSALMVLGLYSALMWRILSHPAHFAQAVEVAKIALLLSASAVYFSPIINAYAVNIGVDADRRFGGFFMNPNDAAFGSLLAIALCIAFPYRRRIVTPLAIIFCMGGIFLTLSKGAMAAGFILSIWYLIGLARIGYLSGIFVLFLVGLVSLSVDWNTVYVWAAQLMPTSFDAYQVERVLSVIDILRGDINESTTTGRTLLWNVLLTRIDESFPWPLGLGSAHHIVGGVAEGEVWQGAHNTFLMLFAEAGPLPLIALAAAILYILRVIFLRPESKQLLPVVVALLYILMSSHNALTLKSACVALALTMVAIDYSFRRPVTTQ